jgi:hypothetical protein
MVGWGETKEVGMAKKPTKGKGSGDEVPTAGGGETKYENARCDSFTWMYIRWCAHGTLQDA